MKVSQETLGSITAEFLNCISSRLAGRDDCKKTTYTVTINHNGVTMSPMVSVYPDRYHRKEGDKMNVVQFVHHYKMTSATLDQFVFGTYQYQLSVDGKRRRWTRIL